MSDCYCIALRTAARRMSSIYDDALAPLGVNIGQYSLLRRIGRHQPVSLTLLGRLSDLDRSTVGRNVKVLERQGFVTSSDGPDGREAMLSLTSSATALLSAGEPLWDKAQRDIERRLGGAAEVDALQRMLDGLAEAASTPSPDA